MFKRMSLVSPHCLFSQFLHKSLLLWPGVVLHLDDDSLDGSKDENVKEDVIDEGDMNLFSEELFLLAVLARRSPCGLV